MKSSVAAYIVSVFLSGLLLFQTIWVLQPGEAQVLCIADDHIAVEQATHPVYGELALDGHFVPVHSWHGAHSPCWDIPLESHLLAGRGNPLVPVPFLMPVFLFSPAGGFPYLPVNLASVWSPCLSFPEMFPAGRYAERSRVFLI